MYHNRKISGLLTYMDYTIIGLHNAHYNCSNYILIQFLYSVLTAVTCFRHIINAEWNINLHYLSWRVKKISIKINKCFFVGYVFICSMSKVRWLAFLVLSILWMKVSRSLLDSLLGDLWKTSLTLCIELILIYLMRLFFHILLVMSYNSKSYLFTNQIKICKRQN